MSLEDIPPPIFPWDEPDTRLDWYRKLQFHVRRMAFECEDRRERACLARLVDVLTVTREAAAAAVHPEAATGPTARERAEARRAQLVEDEEQRVRDELAARATPAA